MRSALLLLAALCVFAAPADLARVRPPDAKTSEHAAYARRGSLNADSYVATNVYPCVSAYRLHAVADGALLDRAVNFAELDGSGTAVFRLPPERRGDGFARGFMLHLASAEDRPLRFDGDARLYLSCGETFSAEAGRTILSFIEIAPDEYLVEVRHLTPATGVQ